jgi:predicted GH43/DUF377 family glycosyl hydrolase
MQCHKEGLLYCASGFAPWAVSHAAMPLPYFPSADVLRVYLSFCDSKTVSRISFIEVSAENPTKLLRINKTPVLDIGEDGAFDDNGVQPLSLVDLGDRLWLYYVGFQLGVKVPYTLFTGLAESTDGGLSFKRLSRVPILDRSDQELFVRTAPCVLKEDTWKLWYIAGDKWITHNDKKLPVYNLRYLESVDGRTWPSHGQVVMDLGTEDEHGFGRPWIWKEDGIYRMLYSIRTLSCGYHMGYAESKNGIHWQRQDNEVQLATSTQGWDSEMICFGAPVFIKNQAWLFYNGNGYGRTGLGLAKLTLPTSSKFALAS